MEGKNKNEQRGGTRLSRYRDAIMDPSFWLGSLRLSFAWTFFIIFLSFFFFCSLCPVSISECRDWPHQETKGGFDELFCSVHASYMHVCTYTYINDSGMPAGRFCFLPSFFFFKNSFLLFACMRIACISDSGPPPGLWRSIGLTFTADTSVPAGDSFEKVTCRGEGNRIEATAEV